MNAAMHAKLSMLKYACTTGKILKKTIHQTVDMQEHAFQCKLEIHI